MTLQHPHDGGGLGERSGLAVTTGGGGCRGRKVSGRRMQKGMAGPSGWTSIVKRCGGQSTTGIAAATDGDRGGSENEADSALSYSSEEEVDIKEWCVELL